MSTDTKTDVCLIIEGAYPYTRGGVSSWTQDFIQTHSDLTFAVVALTGPDGAGAPLYKLPKNVLTFQILPLQRLPEGKASLPGEQEKHLFTLLNELFRRLQSEAHLNDLAMIIRALAPQHKNLGRKILLDSTSSWDMLLRMYNMNMSKTSFLDYFWSWRGLFGGLFSVLLAELPVAKIYHSLSTGYAGLLAARASIELGLPCLLTEHGIYTNERRIEIVAADWLDDVSRFNLAVGTDTSERELKDFWIDTFINYSRFCYEACHHIITLYEGNQSFQIADGADTKKLKIIPNGIEPTRFDHIKRKKHPPTVALIGRVVPIKDIKTYIKAVHILKESIPNLCAYVLGPEDEDPGYAHECRELASHLELEDTLIFTGNVNVADYFNILDVNVLTSLSEAQPLVVLEAGVAGIPCVATDVGACHEMILGRSMEHPKLGPGGFIVPLAQPKAIATALHKLLSDPVLYQSCSTAIAARVRRYYSKSDQSKAYRDLYQQFL